MSSIRSKSIVFVIVLAVTAFALITAFDRIVISNSVYNLEEYLFNDKLTAISNTIDIAYNLNVRTRSVYSSDLVDTLHKLAKLFTGKVQQHYEAELERTGSEEEARSQTITWLGYNSPPDRDSLAGMGDYGEFTIIYDDNNDLVVYPPDSGRVGKKIPFFRDLQGKNALETARQVARVRGYCHLEFYAPPELQNASQHQGYFYYIKSLRVTLGVLASTSAIDRIAKKHLAETLSMLDFALKSMSDRRYGFFFIFDREKNVLANKAQGSGHFAEMEQSPEWSAHLDSLMELADSGTGKSLEFEPDWAGEQPEKRVAFVRHFKPLDWYIAAVSVMENLKRPGRRLVLYQIVIMAVILLTGMISALFFIYWLANPLLRLSAYAKNLPDTNFFTASAGPTEIDDISEKRKDEVGKLARALLFMKNTLHIKIEELVEVTTAKERMESELSIAKGIQLGLLRNTFPSHHAFELHAFLQSAREVGGDLYDFTLLDPNRLCFMIGDVSDKGVPAALFMSWTMSLFQAVTESTNDPSEMLMRINDKLCANNPKSMFVTLFIGVLDLENGEMLYSNAGHNPPLLLRKDQGAALLQGTSGPAAAYFPGFRFEGFKTTLNPGDTLLAYTDGVTEARNVNNELFRSGRLLALGNTLSGSAPQRLVMDVVAALEKFAGDVEQSDDIAMLCLAFKGPEKES